MTRHITNPQGMADLARVVAELDACPTCQGVGHVLERDPDDDTNPSSVVEVQCPDCATESGLAYRDQPHPRERQLHAAARTDEWCECGARETGYRHPGHRYICPRYAQNREAAA